MPSPERSRPTAQIRFGRFKALFVITVVCVAAAAPPNPAKAQTAAAYHDANSSQIETLKATVRRVTVDVVVTDWNGHPVTGLAEEDFFIKEDKVPQTVRSFDVHTRTAGPSPPTTDIPSLPPNTFLNLPRTNEGGTPTVILYDALKTSFQRQAYGEQALLKFLKRRRIGAQMAIFVLSDRLYLVQGFTQPFSAPDVQKEIEHFAGVGRWRHPRSLDNRVAVTLNALTGIARFLASMPGRKNLIWYSSGFPESILPDQTGGGSPDMFAPPNYSEPIRQATDLLDLSHVAIYPVDVRGVTADPTYSAALPGEIGRDFGTGPQMLLTMRSDFIKLDNGVRATMETLADDTGGHAFYGTNDLQGAIERAITSGSTYYSLTYAPTNPTYDGSLRHIKVKLSKPGYHLAYRRVYYADDLDAVARKAADAPQNPLTPSLEGGTPLAHGLLLEAHLETSGPPTPATPAQMQMLSQFRDPLTASAKPHTNPVAEKPILMQQYLISYGLIARQLKLTPDAGARQASLEFGVISYDEDGRKLSGLDTHIDDTIPPARYAKLLTDGYHVVQSIAVPTTAASIRIAVRDAHTNQTGSLEVQLPLAKTAQHLPN